jgi:hypothetical protein
MNLGFEIFFKCFCEILKHVWGFERKMREEKTEQKYEKKQERNSIEEGESGLKN